MLSVLIKIAWLELPDRGDSNEYTQHAIIV